MSERSATLARIVADTLQQQIREGLYQCGDRLAESIIAREMNVSQNTARDALNWLEQAGWVERRPRRGTIVCQFSVDDARELYTLRITLERLVLAWAMETITEAEKIQLGHIIAEARIEANAGSDTGVRSAILKFHHRLLTLAQKPRTASLLTVLLNQCYLLGNLRARHDPHSAAAYTDIITQYGELLTHIRYDHLPEAQGVLERLLLAERDPILTVLDLIGGTPH
jgi:DNA-binding GntR family transcriptional regulator